MPDERGYRDRALEFTVLTAARAGETLGAKWSEIDFTAKTWTVPAARMKAGKAHKVGGGGQGLPQSGLQGRMAAVPLGGRGNGEPRFRSGDYIFVENSAVEAGNVRREKNGHFSNEIKAVGLAWISSRSNSAKPPSTVTRARHHQVGSVCLLLVELVRRYEHRVPAQPKSVRNRVHGRLKTPHQPRGKQES